MRPEYLLAGSTLSWPMIGMALFAVATALHVVVGGLMAVVFSETVETVVLLLGAALITFF